MGLMLQATGATMKTTRNRLLQIFEIRDPNWSHTIHDVPLCHAERKEARRPHRILGERAAKASYDSAESEGRSGGIGLRGARCVTVMFLGWHVNSCAPCILDNVED